MVWMDEAQSPANMQSSDQCVLLRAELSPTSEEKSERLPPSQSPQHSPSPALQVPSPRPSDPDNSHASENRSHEATPQEARDGDGEDPPDENQETAQDTDISLAVASSISDTEKNSEGSTYTGESVLSSTELNSLANDLVASQILNEIDPSEVPNFLTASITARVLARSKGSQSPASPGLNGDLANLEKLLSDKLGIHVPALGKTQDDFKEETSQKITTPKTPSNYYFDEQLLQRERSLLRFDSFNASDFFKDIPENSPRYLFSPRGFQTKETIVLSDSDGLQSASPSEFIQSPATPSSSRKNPPLINTMDANTAVPCCQAVGNLNLPVVPQVENTYQGMEYIQSMPYYGGVGGLPVFCNNPYSPRALELSNNPYSQRALEVNSTLYSPRALQTCNNLYLASPPNLEVANPTLAPPPLGKVLSKIRTQRESLPITRSAQYHHVNNNVATEGSAVQDFARVKAVSDIKAKAAQMQVNQSGGKGRSRRKSAFGGTPETNKAWQAVARARQRTDMISVPVTLTTYSLCQSSSINSNSKRLKPDEEEAMRPRIPMAITPTNPSIPIPVVQVVPAIPIPMHAFSGPQHDKDVITSVSEQTAADLAPIFPPKVLSAQSAFHTPMTQIIKVSEKDAPPVGGLGGLSGENEGKDEVNTVESLSDNKKDASQPTVMETMKAVYKQMHALHNSLATIEGNMEVMSAQERAKLGINDAHLLASRMRREKRHQRMVEMLEIAPQLNVAGVTSLLQEAYGYINTMRNDLHTLTKLNQATSLFSEAEALAGT